MATSADEMKKFFEFERSLAVGMVVELRWTNCFNYYRAKATLSKVNGGSVKGKLIEAHGGYAAGREITVPRFSLTSRHSKWSQNNGVFPVEVVVTA